MGSKTLLPLIVGGYLLYMFGGGESVQHAQNFQCEVCDNGRISWRWILRVHMVQLEYKWHSHVPWERIWDVAGWWLSSKMSQEEEIEWSDSLFILNRLNSGRWYVGVFQGRCHFLSVPGRKRRGGLGGSSSIRVTMSMIEDANACVKPGDFLGSRY